MVKYLVMPVRRSRGKLLEKYFSQLDNAQEYLEWLSEMAIPCQIVEVV